MSAFHLPVSRFGLIGLGVCSALAGGALYAQFAASGLHTGDEGRDFRVEQGLAIKTLRVDDLPSLTERSIFVPDRSPYERLQAPQPAAPVVSMRQVQIGLVGIISISGEPAAVVTFDGLETTVRLGDQTEAGQVIAVGVDSVTFEGESVRRISLFD